MEESPELARLSLSEIEISIMRSPVPLVVVVVVLAILVCAMSPAADIIGRPWRDNRLDLCSRCLLHVKSIYVPKQFGFHL